MREADAAGGVLPDCCCARLRTSGLPEWQVVCNICTYANGGPWREDFRAAPRFGVSVRRALKDGRLGSTGSGKFSGRMSLTHSEDINIVAAR